MKRRNGQFRLFRHWQVYVGFLLLFACPLLGEWIGFAMGHGNLGRRLGLGIGAGIGIGILGSIAAYLERRFYGIGR
jgi:hypothetical protein